MLLLGGASRPSLQAAVVAVTAVEQHGPLDYDDEQLRDEVHQLVSKAVALAGGSAPAVGTPAWRSAEPLPRIAGLLVLAEARLIDDPELIAAEQLRAVSMAISGALDWRDFARDHVPHTELRRRRDQLGPLYQPYTGGPVAWETGSNAETAA